MDDRVSELASILNLGSIGSFAEKLAALRDIVAPREQRRHVQANSAVIDAGNAGSSLLEQMVSLVSRLAEMRYRAEMLDRETAMRTQQTERNEMEENLLTNGTCCVCKQQQTNGCYVPCGHECCCQGCGIRLDVCPVCRQDGYFLRTYRS